MGRRYVIICMSKDRKRRIDYFVFYSETEAQKKMNELSSWEFKRVYNGRFREDWEGIKFEQ